MYPYPVPSPSSVRGRVLSAIQSDGGSYRPSLCQSSPFLELPDFGMPVWKRRLRRRFIHRAIALRYCVKRSSLAFELNELSLAMWASSWLSGQSGRAAASTRSAPKHRKTPRLWAVLGENPCPEQWSSGVREDHPERERQPSGEATGAAFSTTTTSSIARMRSRATTWTYSCDSIGRARQARSGRPTATSHSLAGRPMERDESFYSSLSHSPESRDIRSLQVMMFEAIKLPLGLSEAPVEPHGMRVRAATPQ
jgi:hypothetical protein